MNLEPGQRWRLLRDHGNPPMHLRAGSVGTVREVVPANVAGAHNDEEDAVVLVFANHAIDYDEDGGVRVATGERAVAFSAIDLGRDVAMFEEVTEE